MTQLIRPFEPADYPAARAVWPSTPGVGLSPADEHAAIARFLERNPGLSLVAVDAGGALHGTLLCGHDGRRGLRAAGVDKCHLLVFGDNAQGLAFWRAVGARERTELSLPSIATGPAAP